MPFGENVSSQLLLVVMPCAGVGSLFVAAHVAPHFGRVSALARTVEVRLFRYPNWTQIRLISNTPSQPSKRSLNREGWRTFEGSLCREFLARARWVLEVTDGCTEEGRSTLVEQALLALQVLGPPLSDSICKVKCSSQVKATFQEKFLSWEKLSVGSPS